MHVVSVRGRMGAFFKERYPTIFPSLPSWTRVMKINAVLDRVHAYTDFVKELHGGGEHQAFETC